MQQLTRISAMLMFIGFSFSQILYAQDANTLTPQEVKDGWTLLYNGKDLSGWHSYHEKKPGAAWQIQDGNIYLNKDQYNNDSNYADLVTDKEYSNFDFKVEWKMDTCANSGVMFYVHESPKFENTYESGPEMQIADLACNDDGRITKCRAGDLYDLIAADTEWVNKGGEWNSYEIISNNGHLTFIQNGHKTIQTTMWGAHWFDMIKRSKFIEWPGFGTFKQGHISFQGTENGHLWYRNIKIKQL